MFFPSWKTDFKLSRHLLDTSLTGYLSSFQTFSYPNLNRSSTTRWIDRESSWTVDSFSITGGSIEILFYVFALFLDTSSTASSVEVVFLDTFLDRWLDTSWHLYLSRITEALYIGLSWSSSHFSHSLSIYPLLFSLRTLSSPFNPSTHLIFSLSLLQITWYVFFFFHSSCISCI